MKLFQVDTVSDAVRKAQQAAKTIFIESETVELSNALDRVLATDIVAGEDIPGFHRSTVDGYAIISRDVSGASESVPVFLDIAGKVEMGRPAGLALKNGQAAYVPTGGELPVNADAVVMLEYTESLDDTSVAVYDTIPPGSGVMRRGEDMEAGQCLLRRGLTIDPRDIGVLAALGYDKVDVSARPCVSVFSTGDEIIPPASPKGPGQIRDINGYGLAAMVSRSGGKVIRQAIIKDDYEQLVLEAENAMEDSHMILLSGGSSVGTKDMTAKVIAQMGEPGIFTHGLAMKPGKPTIIGCARDTMVFGLPGHPVSAMMVFHAVVEPILDTLLGRRINPVPVLARLDGNVHAAPGKRSYQLVTVMYKGETLTATPLYGKSGGIASMSQADGYIIIEENTEGMEAGCSVQVNLF